MHELYICVQLFQTCTHTYMSTYKQHWQKTFLGENNISSLRGWDLSISSLKNPEGWKMGFTEQNLYFQDLIQNPHYKCCERRGAQKRTQQTNYYSSELPRNELRSFHFGSVQLLCFFLLNSYTNSGGILKFRPLWEHFRTFECTGLDLQAHWWLQHPVTLEILVVCSIWIGM